MTAGLLQGLTQGRAATHLDAADPRLRGRTYAIPFDRVWTASLATVARHHGWTVLGADDIHGVIRVEARTAFRSLDDVEIHVGLDENGQTRVDLVSAARSERGDLGRNARRIGRFLRNLDDLLRR